MCREALTEYLTTESGIDRERIESLLDLPPADRLTDEEQETLLGLLSPAEAQALKSLLLEVRACDPAVGSGAFLVGLLQAITTAVGRSTGDSTATRPSPAIITPTTSRSKSSSAASTEWTSRPRRSRSANCASG